MALLDAGAVRDDISWVVWFFATVGRSPGPTLRRFDANATEDRASEVVSLIPVPKSEWNAAGLDLAKMLSARTERSEVLQKMRPHRSAGKTHDKRAPIISVTGLLGFLGQMPLFPGPR